MPSPSSLESSTSSPPHHQHHHRQSHHPSIHPSSSIPGGGVVLEHIPHVSLWEDEEVRVAHRPHWGCSPVALVMRMISMMISMMIIMVAHQPQSYICYNNATMATHLQCPCWELKSRQSRSPPLRLPALFCHQCPQPITWWWWSWRLWRRCQLRWW